MGNLDLKKKLNMILLKIVYIQNRLIIMTINIIQIKYL